MTTLSQRVRALEGITTGTDWSPVLDRLSDACLNRLEAILARFGRGGPNAADIEALSDADAGFLVNLIAIKGGST
jgi:hypothetical protein